MARSAEVGLCVWWVGGLGGLDLWRRRRRAAIAVAGCPCSRPGCGDDGAGALQSLQPALRGGLVVGSRVHMVPLQHPAYVSSLASCYSDKLDLANYQIH